MLISLRNVFAYLYKVAKEASEPFVATAHYILNIMLNYFDGTNLK